MNDGALGIAMDVSMPPQMQERKNRKTPKNSSSTVKSIEVEQAIVTILIQQQDNNQTDPSQHSTNGKVFIQSMNTESSTVREDYGYSDVKLS